MSHKSETKGNTKRVLKQLFQNTLKISKIQKDVQGNNMGKTL